MARSTFFQNMVGQDPWELRGTNEARIRALENDTGWIIPTLDNGWVSFDSTYGPPRYRRIRGVVYLQGLVKNGTLSQAITTLPAGFRPGPLPVGPQILLFTVQGSAGLQRINVHQEGYIIPAPGDATWTSLAGITFPADQ